MVHAYDSIPALRRLRQGDCEFKAKLHYTASSKLAGKMTSPQSQILDLTDYFLVLKMARNLPRVTLNKELNTPRPSLGIPECILPR